jgi:ATP-binding cassette subfamily B protein/subfamily B ATP-binding cassette protein MsbA
VDLEAKTVLVPEGYEVRGTGLRYFIESFKGQWYYPYMGWAAPLIPAERWKILFYLMGFIVVITALRGVFRFLNGYLVGQVACRSVLDMRGQAFDQVLRLPLAYFQKGGSADANNRLILDAFYVQDGISALFGKVILAPLQCVAMLVLAVWLAWQIDPRILYLILIAGPVGAITIKTFAQRMRRSTKKQLKSAASILGILEESLSGLRIVKAYTMEGRERKRFFSEGRNFLKQSIKAFKTQALSAPTLEFLATLGVALTIVLGAYLLESQSGAKTTDPSKLVGFFIALVAAFDPMRKLADVNNRLQLAYNGAERLFELIDAQAESRKGTKGILLPRMSQELVFDDVHFSYSPEAGEVLCGVSLRIAAGETIAIVGRTGCGKSTLVNLIPRFYTPLSGRVVIDGHDVEEVTLRSLRDQIGLVSQDTILFRDTVAANIAYGSRPAMRAHGYAGRVTRDEIIAAAKLAHAAEFVEKMPGGYDAEIGTLGMTLSGGQRQRLALARAIIRDPAILILDEATSALDEETQAFVQDTLERFIKGRTVIVIAHRLSTVALARRIVVMDAGRIIDIGTHEELLARCNLYRRLRETGFSES